MPSCRPDVIPHVLYTLMNLKPIPKTILDVGVGYGKWGVLCKEYLRYWKNVDPVVDGVEVFADYKSPAYNVYREVFNSNVMDVIDRVDDYDLVLLVDVIEHLDKECGMLLLHASKRYLVSTPGYWSAQGSCFGNVHETHVSKWAPEDFCNHKIVEEIFSTRNHIVGWK